MKFFTNSLFDFETNTFDQINFLSFLQLFYRLFDLLSSYEVIVYENAFLSDKLLEIPMKLIDLTLRKIALTLYISVSRILA